MSPYLYIPWLLAQAALAAIMLASYLFFLFVELFSKWR